MLFAQIEQWMLFAGVSLMVVIMLRRYWRYFGKLKRRNSRLEKRPRSTLQRDGVAQSPLVDAPPEALRWQVEMHETARDLKAELDSKIGLLQSLVRMADERIAALNVAAERNRYASSRVAAEPLEQLSMAVSAPPPTSPAHEALRRSVYELAERGWDARAIAAEIERPIGDIEMILSLRTTPSGGE